MSGIAILVSDSWGVYVPQRFAVTCVSDWKGISVEDHELLLRGPNDDNSQIYWEVWDFVLYSAIYVDKNQNVWRLFQDGDLFAYCEELMTSEEHFNFFGDHPCHLDLDSDIGFENELV
jgi:hypothetical protein